ncbi:MAG: peptidoglycan synthetase [Flavobacteriaceae bacterium]|nr:peptidoglycan synthetase [Flavobacteriaceae bacterium]
MRIHFIAIGGSAMHNLAIALHHKGYEISGSDDVIYEPSKSRLEALSLLPESFGWFPDKIDENLDAIVLGMHAKAGNPELLKAEELGLTIYSYPEFLYEQSKDKTRVVIGGSHGKTTITSMILHVMNYYDKDVDFMVGAQLEGFDVMVKLTEDNDFIVLEGDEYLSSALDRRPKFHLYKPNIALLSGIAWDHINVFPTFDNYVEQFKVFIDSIVKGGSITYNTEDEVLVKLVDNTENTIRKFPYKTPDHEIVDGITHLETPDGMMPLEIFGAHNLNNMMGAKWICQQMGVDEDEFFEAIAGFKGASKRLELMARGKSSAIFKDFAHSPSKVKATTEAVKAQFSDKTLIACLELHTYSSLNAEFLKEYEGALDAADVAVVFYSPHAVEIKKLDPVSKEQIEQALNRPDVIVYTDPDEFSSFVFNLEMTNTALLFMSSGDYGGLNWDKLKNLVD